MKIKRVILLVFVLIFLFQLNVMAINLDGEIHNDEWVDTYRQNLTLNDVSPENCITKAIGMTKCEKDGFTVDFGLFWEYVSEQEDTNLCKVNLWCNYKKVAEISANGEIIELLPESYHADGAFTFSGRMVYAEIICQVKEGLKTKMSAFALQFVDSAGTVSNVYPIEVSLEPPTTTQKETTTKKQSTKKQTTRKSTTKKKSSKSTTLKKTTEPKTTGTKVNVVIDNDYKQDTKKNTAAIISAAAVIVVIIITVIILEVLRSKRTNLNFEMKD